MPNFFKKVWGYLTKGDNFAFFTITVITLLIILVIEIIIGFAHISDEEIGIVCTKITTTDENSGCSSLIWFYPIVKYTSQATIITMIITFIVLLREWIRSLGETKKYQKNLPRALIEVLIGSLSASAIPTGLSLIICAFYDIDLIQYMSGVEVYIAFAGISIISIAFLSTIRQRSQIGQIYVINKPSDVSDMMKNDSNDSTSKHE